MKPKAGPRARTLVSGVLPMSPRLSKALFGCIMGGILFCGGCATGLYPAPLPPDTTILSGIPYFSQDDYQCGPSAIATVINYWYGKEGLGRQLAFREAVSETYSPSAKGVLGLDLRLYARRLGFKAEEQTGSIDRLRELIDRGIPAIILVDYGMSVYQKNHFMVVTGYHRDSVVVNSGRREKEQIANEDLHKIWRRTAFWTLVIEPSV